MTFIIETEASTESDDESTECLLGINLTLMKQGTLHERPCQHQSRNEPILPGFDWSPANGNPRQEHPRLPCNHMVGVPSKLFSPEQVDNYK
ncbi:hypothetical protein ACFX2F_043599 [Malus domestica]